MSGFYPRGRFSIFQRFCYSGILEQILWIKSYQRLCSQDMQKCETHGELWSNTQVNTLGGLDDTWGMGFLYLPLQITTNEWLRTKEIYSLSVLENESPNQGVSRIMFHLKALGKNSSSLPHCFLWLSAILVIPWLVDASLESLPLPPHGHILLCVSCLFMWHSLCLSSSGKDTSHIGLRSTLF